MDGHNRCGALPTTHRCRTYIGMAVALKTSQAVAELLRSKRHELGLTLREVEKRSAEAGELIPFPTLARVEQGKVDPGVRRLHILLRLYQVPPPLVSDLVELEDFAGKLPKSQDAKKLYEEGVALWKSGETSKGIAYFMALRKVLKDSPADRAFRQKAFVTFAVMAGALGKYHLSLELLGKLFVEPPQPDLLVSALVQAGHCWIGLGAGEVALAFLERAEKHVKPEGHGERAWVLHLRATTLSTMGQTEEAGVSLGRAIAAYRKAADPYGESRALAVRGRILAKQGDAKGALHAHREARAHAEKHGFTRLKSLRTIDESHALLLLGESEKSLALLRSALGEAITDGDRIAEFYAHHGLWKAYLALEQHDQAAFELGAARHYLRLVDETSDETEEVRSAEVARQSTRRAAPKGRRARR